MKIGNNEGLFSCLWSLFTYKIETLVGVAVRNISDIDSAYYTMFTKAVFINFAPDYCFNLQAPIAMGTIPFRPVGPISFWKYLTVPFLFLGLSLLFVPGREMRSGRTGDRW